MLKRTWALIAFVYLTFAEVLSLHPVPDLSLCLIQPEHSDQTSNHDDKKYCPAFHVGAALAFEKTDIWLERHDKSVIGAFTIVLAISTIGLWLATNKLWRAGERQLELIEESSATQSHHMQASVRAAQQSVETAILTLGSDRAWMCCDKVHTDQLGTGALDGVPFTKGLGFGCYWINRGRSPAIGAQSYVSHVVVTRAEDHLVPRFSPIWYEEYGAVPIGPNGGMSSANQSIVDDVLDAFLDNRVSLYFYNAIRYQDIFNRGIHRISEICVRIRFRGIANTQDGKTEPVFFVETRGPQNSAN